jgi:hypothetical protein
MRRMDYPRGADRGQTELAMLRPSAVAPGMLNGWRQVSIHRVAESQLDAMEQIET